MFSFINRTVFDIPLTWDRTRFESTRLKCQQARKLIEFSVNIQFEKQLKDIHLQNLNVEKVITEANEHILKHDKKNHIFDNLTDIATQSLPSFFDKRMANVRAIIQEHCNTIQKVLHQENEYWKEIQSAIDQKLITSNDIHSCVHNTSKTLEDNLPTPIEVDLPLPTENIILTKRERLSIALPSIKSHRIVSSINKTYVIKLEETINNSPSYIPSIENETSTIYSQPNLPAQLYFSPTFLQNDESEPFGNILSPLDQNQSVQPKVILHRVDRTYLLNHLKTEENKDIYIRSDTKTHYPQTSSTIQESISKPPTHAAIKNTKQTRKRKQSVSDDNDTKSNTTIALRKRRAVSVIEIEDEKPKKKITKKRKPKKTNKNEISIRDPSPLPVIDPTQHYSTRFSTRVHRLDDFTLEIDNQSKPVTRKKPTKSRKTKKR